MYHLSELIIQIYCMLQEHHPIISWSSNCKSFIIQDAKYFTDAVLSKYSNIDFETFIIQLKQNHFQCISNNNNVWEFQHPIYHQTSLQNPVFRSLIDTKSTLNRLSLYQSQLKSKIHKKYQRQQRIHTLLACMKKEMQQKDNEMDRWMKRHASTTLPAAIKAIEKIKKEEMDDDISDVVLPTYCYNKKPSAWSVPPRVLLVDDDSIFRAISTRLLEYAGCTIEVAVDGMDALDKLTKGLGYDLVLMDIMMPNLDGISATRSIRQYDRWTPIISMTSNVSNVDIETYKMHGMTDFLQKPLNQSTLYNLLERYCAHLVQRKEESIIIPK